MRELRVFEAPPSPHTITFASQITPGVSIYTIQLTNVPDDLSTLNFGLLNKVEYNTHDEIEDRQFTSVALGALGVASGSVVTMVVDTRNNTVTYKHNDRTEVVSV
jgi:hypothetical protein